MEKIIENKDYSYTEISRKCSYLKSAYPFLKGSIIGKSCLGKNIYAMQIGKSISPVLFAGAFHGSERITGILLLKFLEEICDAINENRDFEGFSLKNIFNNNSLVIVPFVNPDGCEIARSGAAAAGEKASFIRKISNNNTDNYNANARGVDINHNFPADWENLHKLEGSNGINGPAPTRYSGRFPVSEPETFALVNLCEKIKFKHVLAFHSQGEVIYHHFKKTSLKSDKMARIFSSLSGYSLEEPSGLAVGGGFKDYFIEKFSKPGFTIEVGKGKNPLPATDMESIYKKIKKMLTVSIIM